MGPVDSEHASQHLSAPVLKACTDKFKYKADVNMWMDRVRVFAAGGDTRAKGIANGYGYALYAAMDSCFQKTIDAAILVGDVKLGPDGDNFLTFEEHKLIVSSLLKHVAKESPTDAARRFISQARNVYGCKRNKSESFTTFVDRFRGIAQTHLNSFHDAPSEQEKQHVALIMLENAGLDDSTYNTILTMLVNTGEQSSRTDPIISMRTSELSSIKNSISSVQNVIDQSIDDQLTKDSINHEILIIRDKIQTVAKRCSSHPFNEAPTLSFTLENAMSALRDIRSSISETRDEAITGNLLSANLKSTNNLQGQYITPGTGAKKETFCLVCGEKGHWARDRECPLYHQSRKRNGLNQTKGDLREFRPKRYHSQ